MKILVVAPSWVGDLVMAQTLFITIKKQDPEAIIHVLAPKWCLDLLKRMPEVDRGILMPLGHGQFNLKARYVLGKSFALVGYDRAYVLPNSWKSALIPYFAKIPDRRGWQGECRWGLLNYRRKNREDFPRLTGRYCALSYGTDKVKVQKDLPFMPDPKLTVKALDPIGCNEKFGIRLQSYPLGICPGAEFGPAKKWPTEYYAEIIKHFLDNFPGREVWAFGSNKDRETALEIQQKLSPEYRDYLKILCGKTTLEEAVDLLSVCTLVVTNDSGLMHVAAATGTKVVALYGSTSTKYTPPGGDNNLLIESEEECHPCFKRECRLGTFQCMKNLLPALVWRRIMEKWPHL